MYLYTSIANGAHTAYQILANTGTQGLGWLTHTASATRTGTTKLALLAKEFFARVLPEGYRMGQAAIAMGVGVAQAHPFIAGAAVGLSVGIALHLLLNRYHTPSKPALQEETPAMA